MGIFYIHILKELPQGCIFSWPSVRYLFRCFFPAQSHFKPVSAIYRNGFRSFALCCSERGCIAFEKSLRKCLRTLLRTVSQQFLPWVSFFISFSLQIWMYSEICSSPSFTSRLVRFQKKTQKLVAGFYSHCRAMLASSGHCCVLSKPHSVEPHSVHTSPWISVMVAFVL